MAVKLKTPLDGANAERDTIIAKTKRSPKMTMAELRAWLLERNERYGKRKGGL